ncbi:epoxide hydrolase [Thraustotheca clavata]|uniref:Epoxide hydrolase n=1 Tax=Thraustotheca clavata TaxID=74557 RepID=A0A1W0A5Y7_9STRA|nr:epoxide hydrolase [Thraustotheca clavata]
MSSPSEFPHYFVRLNGIRLHYVDVGPRDALPIVLLHGWPDLWYGWRHQINALKTKYRVIVPDQRGFGATSSPDSYEFYAKKIVTQDYVCLLDHLNITKAVFLGHDWGGAAAWTMANFYPERVYAVGAICTPYIPQPKEFIPLKYIAAKRPTFKYQLLLADEATDDLLDANAEKFFKYIFGGTVINKPNPRDFNDNLLSLKKLELDPNSKCLLSEAELEYYVGEYARQGFHNCLNWYRTTELDWKYAANTDRIIRHPALFISAGQDPVLVPAYSKGMERLVPNLTRGHIEEGTHWVLWEAPEKVNAIIMQWLEKASYSHHYVNLQEGLRLHYVDVGPKDHLSIEKAIVLGHDWGGNAAWSVALYQPDRVLAVGAVCTPYFPNPPVKLTLEQIVQFRPTLAYQLFLVEDSTAVHFEANALKFFKLIFQFPPSHVPEGAKDLLSMMKLLHDFEFKPETKRGNITDEDLAFLVAEYERQGFAHGINWYKTVEFDYDDKAEVDPVLPHEALFIGAKKDLALPPSLSVGMEKLIPNLTRGEVENAGHWVLWEAPEEVNQILDHWLSKITTKLGLSEP